MTEPRSFMEDRRSKKGFPGGTPKGASSLARRALGPDEKPIDIDESACFYDWHGQPLSGSERRARLEAFRAGSRPPDTLRSWAELSVPTTAVPLPDESSGIADESEAAPERAFDLVWHDGDPSHAASGLGSTHSEAPVVATRRASERHQRTARAIYVGLLVATVALLATAAVAVLRSNQPPSLAARQETAPQVLAPTNPVGLSADTPASSSLTPPEPSRAAAVGPTTTRPVSAAAPLSPPRSSPIVPAAVPASPPAPNVATMANKVPPSSTPAVAPSPAPAPPRAGPAVSSSGPAIVPGDSPKF